MADNRTPTNVQLHTKDWVPGWSLTKDEEYLLDQLLYVVAGSSEAMWQLCQLQRPHTKAYLQHLMFTRKQVFAGMRRASGAISGVPLSPQHLDPLVLNWAANQLDANIATPQWYYRADTTTNYMNGVTITDDIWCCIYGVFNPRDMTATTTAGATYAAFPDRIRWNVNGVVTLPYDMYSCGTKAADLTTPVTYVPFLPVAEKDVFTEQLWCAGALTHDTDAMYIQDVGVTFGVGGKLTGIGT